MWAEVWAGLLSGIKIPEIHGVQGVVQFPSAPPVPSQTSWSSRRMMSGGKRWRVKEMVGISTGDTDEAIEVRAVNLTMPKLRLTLPA